MSELEEAFHEVMAEMGEAESSWRQVFQGAVNRLNDVASALVAQPAKGSKLEGFMGRQNPTMKARLIATWKPWRLHGTVNITDPGVTGQVAVGAGDEQMLANSAQELDDQVKNAVIAEMMANPKRWLEPTLRKKTDGRPKN